jgi:hypothetical protein
MGIAGLVMVLSTKAQFNVYHPFPDSNAVWGMNAGCMDTNCGTGEYIRDSYAGDTLIDGFTYKRIEHEVLVTAGGCCYPPEGMGIGFLREDVNARKVYWRWPGEPSDTLLYNFNLDIGDTLDGYFGYCNQNWTVQSIDSALVGSNYRKRINFDTSETCGQFSFIEGIGSTIGLTICYYGHFEMGAGLACFSVDGDIFYTAPCGNPDLVPCGELPINVLERSFNKRSRLAAFPNPSSGHFTVNGVRSPFAISVYSSTDQQVWQSSGITIDLTAQPPGVYTAVVTTMQGRQAVRLMVVR